MQQRRIHQQQSRQWKIVYHARGDKKTCSSCTNKYARGGVCVSARHGATQPHRRYVVGKVKLMKLLKEECAGGMGQNCYVEEFIRIKQDPSLIYALKGGDVAECCIYQTQMLLYIIDIQLFSLTSFLDLKVELYT